MGQFILPRHPRCFLERGTSIRSHFRECVKKGIIEILPIDTTEQPVDLLTEPLDALSFLKHRKAVLGW
jgi:hypothetical protein